MSAELDNAVSTDVAELSLTSRKHVLTSSIVNTTFDSYIPSIDGVLVSFSWPPEILQKNAPLAQSSAYVLVHASWSGCVFRPEVGQVSSECLVHPAFPISYYRIA